MVARFFSNLDLSSFFLGIALGIIFCILFQAIRIFATSIRTHTKNQAQYAHVNRMRAIGKLLLGQSLQRVQGNHFFNSFFPLDSILVEPRFIAYPEYFFPTTVKAQALTTFNFVPFLPFIREYAPSSILPGISLEDSINSNDLIMVVADSGCGKTTAICHTVSQLIRRVQSEVPNPRLYPVYLDYIDIFDQVNQHLDFNLSVLIEKALCQRDNGVPARSFADFIEFALENYSIALFLDGLDELSKKHFDNAVEMLISISKKHPGIKIIVTASPTYFGKLVFAGFSPLFLSPWNSDELRGFINNAYDLLSNDENLPKKQQSMPTELQSALPKSWIADTSVFDRPIELCLRLHTAISRSFSAYEYKDILQIYLSNKFLNELSEFSKFLIERQDTFFEPGSKVNNSDPNAIQNHQYISLKIIEDMSALGIMHRGTGKQWKFRNPYFLSSLACLGSNSEVTMPSYPSSAFKWCVVHDYITLSGRVDGLGDHLDNAVIDTSPNQDRLIQSIRWCRRLPNSDPIKKRLLRRLLQQVKDPLLPLSTRVSLAIAGLTGNPDNAILVNYFIDSEIEENRIIGILMMGSSGNRQFIQSLQSFIVQNVGIIQAAGLLSLACLSPESMQQHIIRHTKDLGEDIRMMTAEILAGTGSTGINVLIEQSKSPDLMTKVAAIHGLGYLRSRNALGTLENILAMDDQWLIRKTAEASLGFIHALPAIWPQKSCDSNIDVWLIQFASSLGMGVNFDSDITSILVNAIETGDHDDFRNAINRITRNSRNQIMIRETIASRIIQASPTDQNLIINSLNLIDRLDYD